MDERARKRETHLVAKIPAHAEHGIRLRRREASGGPLHEFPCFTLGRSRKSQSEFQSWCLQGPCVHAACFALKVACSAGRRKHPTSHVHATRCRAHAWHASQHTNCRAAYTPHRAQRMQHAPHAGCCTPRSMQRRRGTIRHPLEAQRVRRDVARRLLPILGQQQRQGARCRGPPAHFQHGDELRPAWPHIRPGLHATRITRQTRRSRCRACRPPPAPYREPADRLCAARMRLVSVYSVTWGPPLYQRLALSVPYP